MELRTFNNNKNETKLNNENLLKSNLESKENKALAVKGNNNISHLKKSKSIHSGHRQRLKEQYLSHGIDSLSDIQKLELLLFYSIPQKDTNPIAHALLDEFGTIREVISASPARLQNVKGIKESTANFLALVGSFLNYANRPSNFGVISSSGAAKDFCTKFYFAVNVEQFYVVCLTKNNIVKNVKMIQSGSLDEVNVQIRNITNFALENKCNRIIISHNHPNGIGIASDEDTTFTYSVICSCLLNSIDIVDHIIVGTDRAISLYEQGILSKLKAKAFQNVKISKSSLLFISSDSEDYKNSLDE